MHQDQHKRERGVIFSGPSIPAILAGEKTVTRRFHALGEAGRVLWVREAFAYITGNGVRLVFKADGTPRAMIGRELIEGVKWTSPIYMPRALSRIELDLLDVRSEHVFAMSLLDFMAEGVRVDGKDAPMLRAWAARKKLYGPHLVWSEIDFYRAKFAMRWDEMHGFTAGRNWQSNPRVFVHTFKLKRIPPP